MSFTLFLFWDETFGMMGKKVDGDDQDHAITVLRVGEQLRTVRAPIPTWSALKTIELWYTKTCMSKSGQAGAFWGFPVHSS